MRMMDIKDYQPRAGKSLLYINYRIILKAKAEGYIKKIPSNYDIIDNNFKNFEYYHKLMKKALDEISILDKHHIKPIKTTSLIKNCEKKTFTPALPQFLHVYDPHNIFDIINIKSAEGLFLTSSRFKDAKIYKLNNDTLKDFKDYYNYYNNAKEGFICIGTNSEAEIEFIEKFDKPSLLIILPHYSLLNSSFDFENIMQISAIDPFWKSSKYGFTLRNNLAYHLSKEMAIFYLSEKSSLSGIIKQFKKAGKPVKVFEREHYAEDKGTDNNLMKSNNNMAKNQSEYSPIQKFILKTLEKENISIDNLIKLSNIKFNINSNEILKNLSMLEMNSEIERCPGGIIKKIKIK